MEQISNAITIRIEDLKESLGKSEYTLSYEDMIHLIYTLHTSSPLLNKKEMFIFEERYKDIKTNTYKYKYLYIKWGYFPATNKTYLGHSIFYIHSFPFPKFYTKDDELKAEECFLSVHTHEAIDSGTYNFLTGPPRTLIGTFGALDMWLQGCRLHTDSKYKLLNKKIKVCE